MNILNYLKDSMEGKEFKRKSILKQYSERVAGLPKRRRGGCASWSSDEALKMMDYASRKCLAEISGTKAETPPTAPTAKQRDIAVTIGQDNSTASNPVNRSYLCACRIL